MENLPSAYVLEVRGLLDKVRNGPAPVSNALLLLQQVGCRVRSFRSKNIVPFTPPFAMYPDLVQEALLAVCNLYGRRKTKPNIALTSMLFDLRRRDIWRLCLAPPNDPHAFVRNVCAVISDEKQKLRTRICAYNMLQTWVAPDAPRVRANGDVRVSLGGATPIAASAWESALPAATKELVGKVFGDHWVHFSEDSLGVLGPDLIITLRPPFLPGLIAAPSPIASALSLPYLD